MYTLGATVVIAAAFFLWSHNPVHGVLTLVVVGLGMAGQLLGAGLEFTAFVVVLVYVGAVTVLFIFVVMMVNLRATPAGFVLVESLLAWGVIAVGLAGFRLPGGATEVVRAGTPGVDLGHQINLFEVGALLYSTDRLLMTFFVALVLFVSMVAAICLSLVSSENYRTQDFYTQIRRSSSLFGFGTHGGAT